jgi:hypothetical protein
MSLYDAATFEEFWAGYARLHSRRVTQAMHALATLTAGTLVLAGIAWRAPLLVAAAPIADYAIAQLAHRRWERNRTQPWRNFAWHLRAELRMFVLVLSGRMPSVD